MHAPCDSVKDSVLRQVETALDNLERAVDEASVCGPTNHFEERAFLDVILNRLSRSLEDNLSAVRFRKNRSAFVNRLPPEILSHVISLSRTSACHARSVYKSLLSLSSVCQRWRRVIITDATFWTTIDFIGSTELHEVILQRSKEAKLLIEIKDQHFLHPVKLTMLRSTLRSQANRIEKIMVTLRSSDMKAIEDAILQPLPSLRCLSLRGCYYGRIPNFDYQIPFTVNTSKLEVLDLFGCSQIPWSCLQSLMCKVRKLKIRFDDEEVYLNFFAHIQSFTELRVLSLHCCFISNLPQVSPVTLPGLTALLIDSSTLTSLVDSLHTPSLRRFTVRDETNRTLHSGPKFDYSSIHYLSVGIFYISGFYRFYIVGSTEKDMPGDDLWNQEFHLSDSCPVKRFQLQMHFNQALTGYINALKILNDVLSKASAARELCLPNLLPDPRCSNIRNHVLLGTIMEYAPLVNSLTLVSTTSRSYLFKR